MRLVRSRKLCVATLVAALLVLPGWSFVLETLPWHVTRYRPVSVSLSQNALKKAESFPDYTGGVPVLTWRDVSGRRGSDTVSPARFAQQIAGLSRAGFHSVTLEQLRALVSGGRPVLPHRPVLLTFDGGVASELTTVDPVLAKYHMSAVSFLPTESLPASGPSYYLSWRDVHYLRRTGRWEFGVNGRLGAHDVVLPDGGEGPAMINRSQEPGAPPESLAAWRARVDTDLVGSRADLHRFAQISAVAIAYPFTQSFDQTDDASLPDALAGLVKQHFALGFTASPRETQSVTALTRATRAPRRLISQQVDAATLLTLLRRMVPAPPPAIYGDLPLEGIGGNCTSTGGQLALRTGSRSRYVRCVPQVSGDDWRNLLITATLVVPPGGTVAIGVRDDGGTSRAEVAIGSHRLVIRQRTGAAWTVDAVQALGTEGARNVAVALRGGTLLVSVGANPPRVVRLNDQLSHGVVSFGLSGNPNSVALVRSIMVKALR